MKFHHNFLTKICYNIKNLMFMLKLVNIDLKGEYFIMIVFCYYSAL